MKYAVLAVLVIGCGPEPEARAPAPPSVTPPAAPAVTTPPPAEKSAAPSAAKKPVKDVYHGVTVTDDYRWLEDAKDPAVKAWSDAQNAYARKHLDAVPGRDA